MGHPPPTGLTASLFQWGKCMGSMEGRQDAISPVLAICPHLLSPPRSTQLLDPQGTGRTGSWHLLRSLPAPEDGSDSGQDCQARRLWVRRGGLRPPQGFALFLLPLHPQAPALSLQFSPRRWREGTSAADGLKGGSWGQGRGARRAGGQRSREREGPQEKTDRCGDRSRRERLRNERGGRRERDGAGMARRFEEILQRRQHTQPESSCLETCRETPTFRGVGPTGGRSRVRREGGREGRDTQTGPRAGAQRGREGAMGRDKRTDVDRGSIQRDAETERGGRIYRKQTDGQTYTRQREERGSEGERRRGKRSGETQRHRETGGGRRSRGRRGQEGRVWGGIVARGPPPPGQAVLPVASAQPWLMV